MSIYLPVEMNARYVLIIFLLDASSFAVYSALAAVAFFSFFSSLFFFFVLFRVFSHSFRIWKCVMWISMCGSMFSNRDTYWIRSRMSCLQNINFCCVCVFHSCDAKEESSGKKQPKRSQSQRPANRQVLHTNSMQMKLITIFRWNKMRVISD